MSSADSISDMASNVLLVQLTKNKESSDKKKSIFHDLPEELQITDIMCAVQEASDIRQLNTNAMDRQRNAKQ